MAQIIKHRRGSLESVASATKRAGELLVVTGSSGITAANGDSLLFLGVDGSTVTPANKVLQGTSVPNLTGGDYDTSVDGIPFYDTAEEKLYILNKAGNVEVKASAQTGGTGIVSGSSQIQLAFTDSGSFTTDNVGEGSNLYYTDARVKLKLDAETVVSGSGQITISDTDGYSTFSSSLASTDVAQNLRLSSIESFTSSLDDDFVSESELAAATGALETKDSAQDVRLDQFATETGSIASEQSAQDNRLSNLESYTGSHASATETLTNKTIDGGNNTLSNIGNSSLSNSSITISGTSVSLGSSITDETLFGGTNVFSGSGQLLNVATDFGSGRVSGDNFGDADGGSTFTGSFEGDGSGLTGLATNLKISGSTGNDEVDLLTDSLSVIGTANEIETAVTDNQIQIGLPNDVTIGNNLTVVGNLDVQGTTTTVDSTTVQIGDNIIELNGTGATNGGIYVKDATAPTTDTGSLVWDSTNDYWKAGVKDSEIKILLAGGDDVVSGSAQVVGILDSLNSYTSSNDTDISNLQSADSAHDTRLDQFATETGSIATEQSAQDARLSSLETETGSIATEQSAQDTRLDQFATETGSIATEQGVQDGRLSNIETYTASLSATFEEKASASHTLVSGSTQIVDLLDGQDVNLGGISGSTLDLTGNAKIDGNITLGGNITIGDASSDTISFGGEVSSDIIPSATNTYDLGSSTDKFAEVHATNLYGDLTGNVTGNVTGQINATNGVISGSSQLDGTTIGNSADVSVTGSFSGSFFGDGSGITGLSTTLTVSGSDGSNDTVSLLDGALSFAGGTGVSATVATDTVTVSVQDGSTSQKGIASFSSTNFGVTSGNVSIKAGGVPASALNADVAGTGISLNGVDNSVEVDYGSTAGTSVEGNTSLTVQGTSNEIEVSGGSVTLGSGGTVTVGLPNDVTIGNDLTVTNDLGVTGNVTVTGNLSVLGTTTTIDSTTVQIGDNILELNIGGAQSTAGLQVTDSTGGNTVSGSLLWDGTNDYWKGGPLGSEKEFARLDSSPTSNTVLKADSNGLLVDSLITDDGTNVTISGTAELRINAASANSFVYFDSNKSLEAVTPSNAGDVIQWNGSSFVASNEIDGGTF